MPPRSARALASVALTLALLPGCAGDTQYVQPAGQDDGALRADAAEVWASVGVEAPTDYALLFLAPDALADACRADLSDLAPHAHLGGCSFPAVVLLPADAAPEAHAEQLAHEVGHLMRPHRRGELDHRHLDCGASVNQGAAFGVDVMCLTGAEPGVLPTARDAAFVRGSMP